MHIGYTYHEIEYGQAFSIISGAGLGKSLRLYEFRKTVAIENAKGDQ